MQSLISDSSIANAVILSASFIAAFFTIVSQKVDAVSAIGIGYSVLDIVNAFVKVNGVDVPYKITERREGDIAMCYADPGKAKEVLGWTAEKNLEDMCRDSWNFAKNN